MQSRRPEQKGKKPIEISLGELTVKMGGSEETIRKLENMTEEERRELLRETIEERIKEKC